MAPCRARQHAVRASVVARGCCSTAKGGSRWGWCRTLTSAPAPARWRPGCGRIGRSPTHLATPPVCSPTGMSARWPGASTWTRSKMRTGYGTAPATRRSRFRALARLASTARIGITWRSCGQLFGVTDDHVLLGRGSGWPDRPGPGHFPGVNPTGIVGCERGE